MDWVTLSRDVVENDRLPRLCVYCGRPSSTFHNRTFEWCPAWVSWWYWAGLLPGAILSSMYGRKMRVSLPVCAKHGNVPLRLGLVGGLGWFVLPAIVGGIGALIGYLVDPGVPEHGRYLALGAAPGAIVGFIIWLVWIIRLASLSLSADEITDDGILLRGLAHDFVMATKTQTAANNLRAEARLDPKDLNLDLVRESADHGIRE
jgi:hypothetical protein